MNNQISFQKHEKHHFSSVSKVLFPAAVFLFGINTASPMETDRFERTTPIEIVDNTDKLDNPTKLTDEELKAAPSPIITVAGKKRNVGIIVDTKTNKLYRYNSDGDVIDGYHVATGRLKSNGKSLTTPGIRRVHHIEDYPYSKAYGTKRKANPKAYGPHILYLTIINPKTGAEEPSNGEFIHGNNNASSIGKHVSGGCIRMDNEVIKMFAKEVKKGTLVLIK